MKKPLVFILCALAVAAAIAGCASPASAPDATVQPSATQAAEPSPAASQEPAASSAPSSGELQQFSEADFVLGGLDSAKTSADAEQLFGKPIETFEAEIPATGEIMVTWSYDFGEISFLKEGDGTLRFIGCSVIGGSVTGPRGIRVGDSFETVQALFPHSGEKVSGDFIVYYSANYDDVETDIILPPSGSFDKEENILYYDVPVTPYGSGVKENPESYAYEAHYNCSIEFDDENRLSRFNLSKGAYAE